MNIKLTLIVLTTAIVSSLATYYLTNHSSLPADHYKQPLPSPITANVLPCEAEACIESKHLRDEDQPETPIIENFSIEKELGFSPAKHYALAAPAYLVIADRWSNALGLDEGRRDLLNNFVEQRALADNDVRADYLSEDYASDASIAEFESQLEINRVDFVNNLKGMLNTNEFEIFVNQERQTVNEFAFYHSRDELSNYDQTQIDTANETIENMVSSYIKPGMAYQLTKTDQGRYKMSGSDLYLLPLLTNISLAINPSNYEENSLSNEELLNKFDEDTRRLTNQLGEE